MNAARQFSDLQPPGATKGHHLSHGEKAQMHRIGGRVQHIRETTSQYPPAADQVGDIGQADDEPSPRFEHAHALVESLLVKEAMLDHRIRDHDPKRVVLKGQRLTIDIKLGTIDTLGARTLDRHAREIGRRDMSADVSHPGGEHAWAAVDL